MSSFTLYVCLISLSLYSLISASTQSAGVRGILMCGNEPMRNIKVKLYDDDTGPDLDDLLAEGTTDSLGQFLLHGSTSELTTIDPKLNIYHDCKDGLIPCQRRLTIQVPKSYVASGKSPNRYFDVGTMNLEAEFEGETRDCVHR